MGSVHFPDLGPEGGFEVEEGSPEHKRLLSEGHVPEGASDGYEDRTVADLREEADSRGLDVEGSGTDGKVVKADLVAALEADDGGQTL